MARITMAAPVIASKRDAVIRSGDGFFFVVVVVNFLDLTFRGCGRGYDLVLLSVSVVKLLEMMGSCRWSKKRLDAGR
jgi:hypothetical protein